MKSRFRKGENPLVFSGRAWYNAQRNREGIAKISSGFGQVPGAFFPTEPTERTAEPGPKTQ